MRSDYIGQCAAFRGLPEYIGFSQFFVPRLNRSQLQQVIEEPAILSGNRISRRLTERLIHDVTEGVDQLPILQHALNQVWHAANNGTEEMDLLHYAMVGGMPLNELPVEHVACLINGSKDYHRRSPPFTTTPICRMSWTRTPTSSTNRRRPTIGIKPATKFRETTQRPSLKTLLSALRK